MWNVPRRMTERRDRSSWKNFWVHGRMMTEDIVLDSTDNGGTTNSENENGYGNDGGNGQACHTH